MNSVVGAAWGLGAQIVAMFAAAILILLGRRLLSNHLIRSNPQWSKRKKYVVDQIAVAVSGAVMGLCILLIVLATR